MGLNVYKIKKWINMISGKSISHVNQEIGKIYSKDEVKGYYNDLTEKVIKRDNLGNSLPISSVDTGEKIYFSIEIFQYGLGAYDLYLLNNSNEMLEKVKAAADWAVSNQQDDGSWVTFSYKNPKKPYSSMAQGEGISLLIRAYKVFKNVEYEIAIHKAINFMLVSIEEGGTTKYEEDDIYFYECTEDPLILNGWIFSIWGIYDYFKYFNEKRIEKILNVSLNTLEKSISKFDLGYWSKYEDGKRICSPFYHKLHIAQLNVMYNLTNREIYKEYADKWLKYQKNFFYRNYAFIKKIIQKVFSE